MSKASLSLLDLAGVKPYQPKKGEEYMNEDQILHFKKNFNCVARANCGRSIKNSCSHAR